MDIGLDARATGLTAGWEPLSADTPSPVIGLRWRVRALSAIGRFAVNPINLVTGIGLATSGLYLVSANSTTESLAVASSTLGWDPSARGFALPVDWAVAALGSGFAFTCTCRITDLIVPAGYLLRFLASINPANAQPGPGAASSVYLTAWGVIERNIH